VAALDIIPVSLGWEVDSLKPGSDGFWYFRGVQIPEKQYAGKPANQYYRVADLSLPGEEISLGLWRASLLPEALKNAPPLLAEMLETLFRTPGFSGPAAALVISAGFPGTRIFSGSPGSENLTILCCYYREGPEPLVLALSSDGRALAIDYPLDARAFDLPALPEGFIYTGIGLTGEVLIASWEEQQDSAVGSAGFMALNAASVLPEHITADPP
jgi:hypothetical protein